ncbi:hypothetical protein ACFWZA_05380, partial [[Kitasatospora] papulosa]|uniref:hypothetical protein n=1 Tax=[Kitasatospora] papulosa TaxID=1464011 RepID=UPI0036C29D2D
MIVHGSTGPGNSRPGRTVPPSPRGVRSALRNCAKGVLVLTLALGATTACGPFSDSGSGSSKNRDGSSDGGSRQSEDWKAGDCAGPDTSRSKDGFQALDCDDPKATIKALEVKDGEIFAGAVECPAGTDEIISVKVSFGGDASAGLPSKTICGRNLSDDHPGDAGAGGGQLVVGDCVDDQAKEVACASGGEQGPRPHQDIRGVPRGGGQPHRALPEPRPPVRRDLHQQGLTAGHGRHGPTDAAGPRTLG